MFRRETDDRRHGRGDLGWASCCFSLPAISRPLCGRHSGTRARLTPSQSNSFAEQLLRRATPSKSNVHKLVKLGGLARVRGAECPIQSPHLSSVPREIRYFPRVLAACSLLFSFGPACSVVVFVVAFTHHRRQYGRLDHSTMSIDRLVMIAAPVTKPLLSR